MKLGTQVFELSLWATSGSAAILEVLERWLRRPEASGLLAMTFCILNRSYF